jgi:hypothetical protein
MENKDKEILNLTKKAEYAEFKCELKEKECDQLKSQLSDITINLSKSGASKLGSSKTIEEDKILEQSNEDVFQNHIL